MSSWTSGRSTRWRAGEELRVGCSGVDVGAQLDQIPIGVSEVHGDEGADRTVAPHRPELDRLAEPLEPATELTGTLIDNEAEESDEEEAKDKQDGPRPSRYSTWPWQPDDPSGA